MSEGPEYVVLTDIDARFTGSVDVDAIRQATAAALTAAARTGDTVYAASGVENVAGVEVSIRVTGDEEIHALNRDYRGVDRPTDVLSFSLIEGDAGPAGKLHGGTPLVLGDIVISYPYAERQATELGHEVSMEIAWLIIHGTLQLLGYQHEDDVEAEHMEELERVALRALGFSPDYASESGSAGST